MIKRFRVFLIAGLLALSVALVACGGATKYSIEFYAGDVLHATLKTAGNASITLPSPPADKDGKSFYGWYFDDGVWTQRLTADTYKNKKLESDVKVYARWTTPVEGANAIFEGFSKIGADSYSISLSNATSSIDLNAHVLISKTASWSIIENEGVSGSVVQLTEGDNFVKVLVVDAGVENEFTLKIRRRPLYTVSFETYGGAPIANQQVEEGLLATRPADPTKELAQFKNWNHNFSMPILSDKTIVAQWEAVMVGKGTSTEPYRITVSEQLRSIRDKVNTTREFLSKLSVVLENDIDLGGEVWDPIGNGTNWDNSTYTNQFTFYGLLDGKGYTIKNFKAGTGENVGLFGYNAGVIRNLNVADFDFEITKSAVMAGGLVALNKNGTIENCTVNGSITLANTGSLADSHVGLFAGAIDGGRVKNSSAEGTLDAKVTANIVYAPGDTETIIRPSFNVGGFAGSVGSSIVTLSTAQVDVSVEATDTITVMAGGFTGALVSSAMLTSLVAEGDVNVEVKKSVSNDFSEHFTDVGGLVGIAVSDTSIQSSSASGSVNVSSHQGARVGGLVGSFEGEMNDNSASGFTVAAVTDDGTTLKRLYIGGLIGYTGAQAVVRRNISSGELDASGATPVHAGGLIGRDNSATLQRNIALSKMNINALEAALVGGLVGDSSKTTLGTNYRLDSQIISITIGGTQQNSTKNSLGDSANLAQVNSSDFYSTTLSWDSGLWDFNALNFSMGKVAALRFGDADFGYTLISNAADLMKLSGEDLFGNYKLTANINLAGQTWIPAALYGVMDGNGFKISNYNINKIQNEVGFFSNLYGTVKNLSLENFTVSVSSTSKSQYFYAGGLAGYLLETGIVVNCHVNGAVNISAAAGALFGGMMFGIIYNDGSSGAAARVYASSATGTVTTSLISPEIEGSNVMTYVGGVAAWSVSADISGCYADVVIHSINRGITDSVSSYVSAGGLLGQADDATSVTDCYAAGSIYAEATSEQTTGGYGYIGGLIGANYSDGITNSYSTCDMEIISMNGNGGGLVGVSGGSVTNSFSTANIKMTNYSPIYNPDAGIVIGIVTIMRDMSNTYAIDTQTIELYNGTAFVPYAPTNNIGAKVSAATLNTKQFYTETLGWSESVWTITEGSLPTLKSMDW